MVTICRLESWVGAGVGPSQGEWHEVAGASALCGLGVRGHVSSSLAAPLQGLSLAAQSAHKEGRTGSAKQPAFPMTIISSWLREVKITNII